MLSNHNSQIQHRFPHKYIDSNYLTQTITQTLTNHHRKPLNSISNNQYTHNKQSRTDIVIDLTGNVRAKIATIYKQLINSCDNGEEREQRLYQIAQILGDKIERLRHDREVLKDKYVNDVHQLRNRIVQLEQQNMELRIERKNGIGFSNKIICSDRKINQQNEINQLQYSDRENDEVQCIQYFLGISKQPHKKQYYDQQSPRQYQRQLKQASPSMDDHDNNNEQQQQQQNDDLERLKIQKIALKYNICEEQLQYLLSEYLKAEADGFSCPPSQVKKLKQLKHKLATDRQKNQLQQQILSALKQNKIKIKDRVQDKDKDKVQDKDKLQLSIGACKNMNKQNYY